MTLVQSTYSNMMIILKSLALWMGMRGISKKIKPVSSAAQHLCSRSLHAAVADIAAAGSLNDLQTAGDTCSVWLHANKPWGMVWGQSLPTLETSSNTYRASESAGKPVCTGLTYRRSALLTISSFSFSSSTPDFFSKPLHCWLEPSWHTIAAERPVFNPTKWHQCTRQLDWYQLPSGKLGIKSQAFGN